MRYWHDIGWTHASGDAGGHRRIGWTAAALTSAASVVQRSLNDFAITFADRRPASRADQSKMPHLPLIR